jgi:hypothetical protein
MGIFDDGILNIGSGQRPIFNSADSSSFDPSSLTGDGGSISHASIRDNGPGNDVPRQRGNDGCR